MKREFTDNELNVLLDFADSHARTDAVTLLLHRDKYPDIDIEQAIQQIEGRRQASVKWPTLVSCRNFLFPPRLNREQSSSDLTAEYKRRLAESLAKGSIRIADLTGGMGIDTLHLAEIPGSHVGLVPQILKKAGAAVADVQARVEQELASRPHVSGDTEMGKIYVTQAFSELMVRAEDHAKRLTDEYVSVEHFLLAMTDHAASGTKAYKILKDAGITTSGVMATLKEVRGNQRITTDNPEEKYEALKKYGSDPLCPFPFPPIL